MKAMESQIGQSTHIHSLALVIQIIKGWRHLPVGLYMLLPPAPYIFLTGSGSPTLQWRHLTVGLYIIV